MLGYIFLRRRKGGAPKYYVRFRDLLGRTHTEAAGSRREARTLLEKRRAEVADGKLAFGDRFRVWRMMPLSQHVADFKADLEARRPTAKHVYWVGHHLEATFREIEAHVLAEVTPAGLRGHLYRLLEGGGACKTANHRLQVLRQFYAWLMRNGRWMENAAQDVKGYNVEADPRRRLRRAFTPEELERLVKAARRRPVEEYMRTHAGAAQKNLDRLEAIGQERATLYVVAALAGPRQRELKLLAWGDVRLDEEPPTLVVRAASAKGRREDVLPLAPLAADMLREWRAGWTRRHWRVPGGDDKVFRVGRATLRMLRKDLKAAGVPEVTRDGRVDFHALRHTFGTWLVRGGVNVRVAQELLRHRDVRTTLAVYAHAVAQDKVEAVGKLPDWRRAGGGAGRAQA